MRAVLCGLYLRMILIGINIDGQSTAQEMTPAGLQSTYKGNHYHDQSHGASSVYHFKYEWGKNTTREDSNKYNIIAMLILSFASHKDKLKVVNVHQ